MFKGELGGWAFVGLCVLIAWIIHEITYHWNAKHPIKVESKDPDGWPYYIDRNTGAMYCKFSEMIMSKKFQREGEELSKLVKEHNGELPFID